MRAGIRKKLLDSIPELKGCYEPTVPNKTTDKPYAVVLQGSDDKQNNPINYKRTIEIWLYEKRLTFLNLDSLMEKVIAALDLQTITEDSGESYTCTFNGTIGQDVIDEEWDAIARGLQFNIIALHEADEIKKDAWTEAVINYIKTFIDIPIYSDCWKKDFAAPSGLCRILNVNRNPVTFRADKVIKTIRCHFVSKDKSVINNYIDIIENRLIQDTKIPLSVQDKRYLTINSIKEDREADPFITGQLSIECFRLENKNDTSPIINHIYGEGNIKE